MKLNQNIIDLINILEKSSSNFKLFFFVKINMSRHQVQKILRTVHLLLKSS